MELQFKLQKTAQITYLQEKKQQTKVLRNIFSGFKFRRNVKLMFWTPKDSIKRKWCLFSGYKQRNKVSLVYLDGKLQQDRYGWCISS